MNIKKKEKRIQTKYSFEGEDPLKSVIGMVRSRGAHNALEDKKKLGI